MLALIMAGGAGSRLNAGEKPLVLINGRPMIAYVIDAFEEAACEPVVVTSPKTPMTSNWCRAQGMVFRSSSGYGYIEDMVESVQALDEEKPLFVSVSDIPCVPATCIRLVRTTHEKSRAEACSAWVPIALIRNEAGTGFCRELISGVEAVPAGLNVLCGSKISVPQTETQILIHDPGLAINVNTPADRIEAEEFLRTIEGNSR